MKGRISFFNISVYTVFVLLSMTMLYPFWYCLIGSFTRYSELITKTILIFPSKPTAFAYKFIIGRGVVFRPMFNTALVTAIGTPASLLACSYTAYGLSKKFPGSTAMMMIMLFSMFIPSSLIPLYLLYKNLALLDTYAVYIVPQLIGIFNIIIFRTTFLGFEYGLIESAKIDGASEFRVFFRIVLPLSKGMLAAIGLFLAVGYWNTMTTSLFFVNDQSKKLLQEMLYRVTTRLDAMPGIVGNAAMEKIPGHEETLRLAVVVVSTVPILIVYPFLQKHFVKGVLIGAVRG